MERNDVLIDKVMDYIREHPEEWDQCFWVEKHDGLTLKHLKEIMTFLEASQ